MEHQEEEVDSLHRQIFQLVVDSIPDAVKTYADMVKERRALLKQVSGHIEIHDVKKLTFEEAGKRAITGADGGANGKELEGFYFGIAGAIACTSCGLVREDELPISLGMPLLWDDEFDPGRRAATIRDRFMYEVAERAVVEKKPDLLLVDGPLVPNAGYIPISDDSSAYKKDYEAMIKALFSLLNSAKKEFDERGMLFACVVKRVRSTRYSSLLNLAKPIRDSCLLNPLMKKGQRTGLINPVEGKMLRDEFPEEHRRVKQFFVKGSSLSPVRVEVPDWLSDRVDELASLVYSTCDPFTGVPFQILRADALTRVSIPTTDLTYTRFISRVMDKVKSGELSEEDLDMANLRRLEIWRL